MEGSSSTPPPPGWYDDPDGAGLRWWDGTRWTEHVKRESQPPPQTASRISDNSPGPTSDGWLGRLRDGSPRGSLVVVAVAVGLGLAAIAYAANDDENLPPTQVSTTTAAVTTAPVPPSTEPAATTVTTDLDVAAAKRRRERARKNVQAIKDAFHEVEGYCDDYSDAQFKIDYGRGWSKQKEGYNAARDLLSKEGSKRLEDAMFTLIAASEAAPNARVGGTTAANVTLDAIDVVNTQCEMPELAGSFLDSVKRADRGF